MSKIYQNIGGAVTKIISGFLSLHAFGLILGDLFSQIIGMFYIVKDFIKDPGLFHNVSFKNVKAVAKEFKKFPIYSGPSSIFRAFELQLPIFMLAPLFGLEVVGWYFLAYNILILPGSLISSSLNPVYFAEVASLLKNEPKKLQPLYYAVTKQLLIIAIPIILIIAISAQWLFPIIFGPDWLKAGIYCLPLSLVAISDVVISPTSHLETYGFNQWQLYYNAFRTFFIFSIFLSGFYFTQSPLLILTFYAIGTVISYFGLFLLNLKAIKLLAK